MVALIFVIGIIIVLSIGMSLLIRLFKKDESAIIPVLFALFYGLAIILFVSTVPGSEYYEAVDDIEGRYTAFAGAHIVTLLVYLALFLASAVAVQLNGRELPPLLLTLCMVFLMIGIGISIAVMVHLSGGYDESYIPGTDFRQYRVFSAACIYPLMNIILAIVLINRTVKQEADAAANRLYKNEFLNRLNMFIARKPAWVALILLLPVFTIITLILLLFGQETNSIVKTFTETTTWLFSQQTHPPLIGHKGHYLCTTAACGHPKVVKPVRLGKRHGNEIIVNRQLMIANAYEEMISDYAPALHRFIRRLYDKYGYPLSKHINTPFRSDIIYLMMKPLEYFFLINLYLFCIHPERKINKQYL